MVLILFALVRELQDLGVEEEALEAWYRMQQGSILQLRSIFNWLLVLFSTGYFCISLMILVDGAPQAILLSICMDLTRCSRKSLPKLGSETRGG